MIAISDIFKVKKLNRWQFRLHAARLVTACILFALANFTLLACASHSFTPPAMKTIYNLAAHACSAGFIIMLVAYTPAITVPRLKDAGLPARLASLLIVPGVGTLLFMALLVIPSNWREELGCGDQNEVHP